MKTFAALLLLAVVFSCGHPDDYDYSYAYEHLEFTELDHLPDGRYCAEVEYYYPKTGTQNDYRLIVEVKGERIYRIEWPNGGWLDDSHHSRPDISSGNARFESDRGVEYEVELINYSENCRTDRSARGEAEDARRHSCGRCGTVINRYDDYCDSCQDEIEDEEENTCSRCGGYEYGIYGGLCSNCTDDEDDNDDDW